MIYHSNQKRVKSFVALCALVLFLIFGAIAVSAGQFGEQGNAGFRDRTDFLVSIDKNAPGCERLGGCFPIAKRVFASLEVQSLRSNLSDPNTYTVSGWFSLNWLADAYPDMQPSNLSLGCRSGSCRFGGWKNSWFEQSGGRKFWRAWFELEAHEADSLFSYPFDQHWVKILIQSSDLESNLFIDNIDINGLRVGLSPSLVQGRNSNFLVDYATVGYQVRIFSPINIQRAPGQPVSDEMASSSRLEQVGGKQAEILAGEKVNSENTTKGLEADHSETSVSFHLVRRTPAALLMIIIPMMIILFGTILAYHWRESSPASRFGSSGLLTTVSLFYSSRVFRPDVDELVFSDLWFIAVFVLLTINNLLLIWLFRFYKHRNEVKRANASLLPAWRIENKLSLISGAIIGVVLLSLYGVGLVMLRPPSIPIEFLAGNSNYDDVGASIVKVIRQNELLPANSLIEIPPRTSP